LVQHVLHELPVGIAATGTRRESSSLGCISVRADRYWGAGTQWALKVGMPRTDRLPDRFHRCYGIMKKAAALSNGQAGRLPHWKSEAISRAADDLIAGKLAGHFPLSVWQSGSGFDTDTNVNEVIANRAIQLLGGQIGSREPIDPARDVGMGQILKDVFTTSLHIATVIEVEETLAPPVRGLVKALDQVAMPSLACRLLAALARIDEAEGDLHEIVGGDARDGSAMLEADLRVMAASVVSDTRRPFILAGRDAGNDPLDAIVAAMGAIRGLAVTLSDVAEFCLSAGGAEWQPGARPALEAMAMVCINAMGLDQIVVAAAARGNREPRALRPVIVASVLNAIRSLAKVCVPVRKLVLSWKRM
jgi:fumarate hydratase, class II